MPARNTPIRPSHTVMSTGEKPTWCSAIVAGQRARVELRARVHRRPASRSCGITFQYRSSQWNTSCHTAKNTSDGTMRLVQRDIRNTNGNAQKPTRIAMRHPLPLAEHPVLVPDRLLRHVAVPLQHELENAVYAQKNVNENIHLPMSW